MTRCENDIALGRNLLLTTTTAPAPGVNGLAPRLPIAYGGGRERQRVDRDDPADILGYGWRVAGLSAIHRCGKNTDNAAVLLGSADNPARADVETTGGAAARTRRLLLHTVRAVLDGRKVREYRLLSETASQGWRRLDKVQLCGFDENGANPQCLAALDVDWIAPAPELEQFRP